MLWRSATPPPIIPSVVPVPDADGLRRAALQASWVRGRWVARRRVIWRWLQWALVRFVMPALAVTGVVAWLWLGVLPQFDNPLEQLTQWSGMQRDEVNNMPVQAPATPPASETTAVPPVAEAAHNSPPTPLPLKFEARWAAAAAAQALADSAAPSGTETDPQPSLKPENWLHSKEP